MESLLQDVRYGLRSLLQRPGFALASILSLGLGIGASTVVFTCLKAVYLRPLPGVHDSASLLTINRRDGDRGGLSNSWEDYRYYRDHNAVFDGVLAHDFAVFNLSAQRSPEVVTGGFVSGNYFSVLGVPL